MTTLERISTLLRANINDLIDRAEDPEKLIKQLLLDMRSRLLEARAEVAAARAIERQLARHLEKNLEHADEWQHRAELAVKRGQDDLAREALRRRNAYQQAADGFREQRDWQLLQLATLEEALDQLENKIVAADAGRDLLIARHHRAEPETHIRRTLAEVDPSTALASYERMEEKVSHEEARAAALRDLEYTAVDDRFTDSEGDAAVERQLAELKTALARAPREPPTA